MTGPEPGRPSGPRSGPAIGAVIAAAFVDAVERRGHDLDHRLALLAHRDSAAARPDEPVIEDPYALGTLHERLADDADRVRRGAWYTPRWLADRLVAEAVVEAGTVADPACGGGMFLLAAADRLVALGVDPDEVVRRRLWGADIDPLAVAVAQAALWWWSCEHGRPAVASSNLVVGDALVDVDMPRVRSVVGNPPFLGQLKRATTVDGERRVALQRRWGGLVRPYTDAAWLFLAAAAEAIEPGGRLAMVQPQSVLGARDAGAVRAELDRCLVLESCWVDDGTAFAASVDVCAPVFRRPSDGGAERTSANDWTGPMADARGVPALPDRWRLAVPSTPVDRRTLGDAATVVAGFRDEYYGLAPAVAEAAERARPDAGSGLGRPLVTVGAIDPLRRRPGSIRYAKQEWHAPVVDIDAITPGRAARWATIQQAPKLLVATQTRVVEAVVDEVGSMVGSVPAIAVIPADPERLWHLAAALHAPVVSVWMARRTAGTALAADACKPTAATLAELALPTDADAWDEAAALARTIAAGTDAWDEFAMAADAAYEVDDGAIRAWWRERLPVR